MSAYRCWCARITTHTHTHSLRKHNKHLSLLQKQPPEVLRITAHSLSRHNNHS